MRCQEVRDGAITTVITNHSNYSNNHNFNSRPQYNKPQDNKQGRPWGQKGKDSKITLTQESAHFIPTDFSNDFFKQINLAMKNKVGRTEEEGNK